MIIKKSKINTIASAFIKTAKGIDGSEDIPQKELDHRRESCNACPYNSKNTERSKKGLFSKFREGTLGDFCSICGCNIKEKTMSPNEECALVDKGRKPLWNRMVVLTDGETADLLNLTPGLINIDSDSNNYIVYVDTIVTELTFRFGLRTKEPISVLQYVRSTCPCVKVNTYTSNHNTIEAEITLKPNLMKNGLFTKYIYVCYTSEKGDTKRYGVQIKGQKG